MSREMTGECGHMAILVTGGAGYIGSHMVWTLLDAGEDVVVLDRLSTGFRWSVAPRARFYLGDVADADVLKTIFIENDIEAIIHFAGSAVVPASVSDPLSYYDNNSGKTRALMSAAIDAGIRHFVFSSTAAVYGPQKTSDPVREDASLNPENPYGQSKLMTEFMLRDAAAAYDFNYVALRYFNVAGADPRRPCRTIDLGCHASHQGCLRGSPGQAGQRQCLRHRLSDARRYRRARLHPCQRSCRGASESLACICAGGAGRWSPIADTAPATPCSMCSTW
jgi:nucleoside-diphosphate-sugar epimerase